MKTNGIVKASSILSLALSAFVFSCNDEDWLSLQDSQDITEEALTDSYFQDIDDMAGVAIEAPSEEDLSGGRTKGVIVVNDNRFQCEGEPIEVTIERAVDSEPAHPKGVITINFGATGCTDLRGNIRTGKLILTYDGRRFMPGATIVTTTDNYTINGVKLEGVRTLTNVTGSTEDAPRFTATLVNGKATFEDGSIATRQSTITWRWVRATNPVNDQLVVDMSSSATGTTRGGREYEVSLLEDLTYQRFCGIAVSGIKRYFLNNEKEIIIDYGDGECDRRVTVSIDGETRDVRI